MPYAFYLGCAFALLVLGGGLEPPCLAAYAPQTYVSAISPPEREVAESGMRSRGMQERASPPLVLVVALAEQNFRAWSASCTYRQHDEEGGRA